MMTEQLIVFVLAATALLGSPGPGIAALMAVGRASGFSGGLPYFGGLLAGLATAAALTAGGLLALIEAVPLLHIALTIASLGYLLWLAWTIASAPLDGGVGGARGGRFTPGGGFLLGITNPKAYLAFASLFGSFAILSPAYGFGDGVAKWAVVIGVIVAVDLAWLMVGAALGRLSLSPVAERTMNVAMGGAILLACVAALL